MLSAAERGFAARAIARRRLFLALSWIGIVAGAALTAWYALEWWRGARGATGARVALVILVLLNARQNLRQYRYAGVLEKLVRP